MFLIILTLLTPILHHITSPLTMFQPDPQAPGLTVNGEYVFSVVLNLIVQVKDMLLVQAMLHQGILQVRDTHDVLLGDDLGGQEGDGHDEEEHAEPSQGDGDQQAQLVGGGGGGRVGPHVEVVLPGVAEGEQGVGHAGQEEGGRVLGQQEQVMVQVGQCHLQ